MENIIYWQGKAVGIDCGSYISWFPSAPREAIAALRPAFEPRPSALILT